MGTTVISSTSLNDRLLTVVSGAATLQNLTLSGAHAPDGADGMSSALSGGAATAGQPGADGGAISNSGSLSLDRVVVTNNSAGNGGAGGNGGRGGGIYNGPTASLTLTDVTVSANRSGNGGRGGAGGSGVPPIGNGAPGGCCGDGGGIYNDGGAVTVTGSTLAQNIAGNGGAGGQGGNPFSGSPGAGGTGEGGSSGGAIATAGGTVSITNSTIAENLSGKGGDGGAAGFDGGTTLILGPGGAAGNGSGGGGIFARAGATVTTGGATIAQNLSGGPGTPANGSPSGAPGTAAEAGGVYANGASVNLADTLLAGNAVGNCGGPTSPTDGGHNLSFGVGCPSTFISGDPRLGPLQENGGPTQTMDLRAGSAAIDAVPAGGAGCSATDQRGVPRPSGTACDIGAYEVAPPVVTTGPAASVTTTMATFTGTVTMNAAAGSVVFQYGPTTAYGSSTPPQQRGGTAPTAISAPVIGLSPKTVYHYRLLATSPDGSQAGTDETFTTPATPPGGPGRATAPKLGHLLINPGAFRTAKRKRHPHDKPGTTIAYTDSQRAIVTLTVSRCTKATKRAGCVRYAPVGTLRGQEVSGANRFHWDGRVSGRVLSAGR